MKGTLRGIGLVMLALVLLVMTVAPCLAASNGYFNRVVLTRDLRSTWVNPAGGSANPFDFTGTLGIMDNSDTFLLFDINLTNANHTGSANTVTIFDVAGITGDSAAQENVFKFGTGWDLDLNATTSMEIGVDDTSVVVIKDPAGVDSGATNDMVEIAGTTPIDTAETNTHNFLTIDAAIGNSSGGTNVVNGLEIDAITGDAQVTENGINIGTGWDVGITSASPVVFNAGITCDTDKFAVADTTGIVTLGGGGTIDNNTSASVLNLTETTVRVTGIHDVTGNSTLASVDVGGGSGGSGATITAAGAVTADALATLNGGIVCDTDKFAVADTTGIVTLGGGGTIDNNTNAAILNLTETTVKVTGALETTGNLTVGGSWAIQTQTAVAEATNSRVCTSDDYGKLIVLSAADAINVTLPANGATAGTYIDFLVTAENGGTVTISSATADTLQTANSADSDAVTFATGHRIAAYARCISNGTYWAAINLGQTTMGVTDTD